VQSVVPRHAIPALGKATRPLDASVLAKHFLDIPAFPLHLVGCCCVGNDKGAALATGAIGEKFFKTCRVEGSKKLRLFNFLRLTV
jgi:hypothetical protein